MASGYQYHYPLAPADAERLRAERFEAQADAARGRAAYLDSLPKDEYDEGTAVVFTHTFADSSRVYSYAAIKCKDFWYTTGPMGGNEARTWQNLLAFADEGSLYWCPTAEPVA